MNLFDQEGCSMVPLQAPRVYLCARMPDIERFRPPATPDIQHKLTETTQAIFNLPALTGRFREVLPNVWLCIFFHGRARPYRAPTYEAGRPASITYIPRHAEILIADWRHGLLYLTGQQKAHLPEWLPPLTRILFPGETPATPPNYPTFALETLRFLAPGERHPIREDAPWAHLLLKAFTSREPGLEGAHTRRLWPGDGWDELDCGAEQWPNHLCSATLGLRLHGLRKTYPIELYQGLNRLRAPLAPETFHAIATLINLCA